jgi:hypothetical protein
MMYKTLFGAIGLAAMVMSATSAAAFDDSKYPALKGQWYRPGGAPRFDPEQPRGPKQNPPLTAEWRVKFEASQKDMANGGQGNHPVYRCLAWGMPGMMNLYGMMEVVIFPQETYLFIDDGNDSVRRIYTDGRSFPKPGETDPTWVGYSIGQWIDEDGDGKYDVLEVETRGPFKGPRAFDNSGLILHPDGETVVKERIYLDKNDPTTLYNRLSVEDHTLTRPWTVLKTYKRDADPRPYWREDVCAENNTHVLIGGENYMRDADGELMPTRKGQKPPDLRYFKQTKQTQN